MKEIKNHAKRVLNGPDHGRAGLLGQHLVAALAARAGMVAPGVRLLGLSAADVKKLDAFEQRGVVMRRTTAPVVVGQKKRRAFICLKIK